MRPARSPTDVCPVRRRPTPSPSEPKIPTRPLRSDMSRPSTPRHKFATLFVQRLRRRCTSNGYIRPTDRFTLRVSQAAPES